MTTQCCNGHALTPETTGTTRNGHRFCRLCHREAQHRYQARNRERVAERRRQRYTAGIDAWYAVRRATNAQLRAVADRHKRRWTQAEIELLTGRRGLSDTELAAALGRTIRAVESGRRRLQRINYPEGRTA